MYLIAGLGNPGREYATTRHNLGRIVVQELGQKIRASFTYTLRYNAYLAKGCLNESEVTLMLPETYMNESGTAIGKFLHYHKMASESLFVVVDDADIPFGTLRFRDSGSSGGHNGLKSIEGALGTQKYARLRCGIGRAENDLRDFVLSSFSKEEQQKLPQIVDEAIECLMKNLESRRRE